MQPRATSAILGSPDQLGLSRLGRAVQHQPYCTFPGLTLGSFLTLDSSFYPYSGGHFSFPNLISFCKLVVKLVRQLIAHLEYNLRSHHHLTDAFSLMFDSGQKEADGNDLERVNLILINYGCLGMTHPCCFFVP